MCSLSIIEYRRFTMYWREMYNGLLKSFEPNIETGNFSVFIFRHNFPFIIWKVTIIYPADVTVFSFLEAGSPLKIHCFNCFFVSQVEWWIQVSSTVINRWEKSHLFLQMLQQGLENAHLSKFVFQNCAYFFNCYNYS